MHKDCHSVGTPDEEDADVPALADVVTAPGLQLDCLAGAVSDEPVERVVVAERLLDLRDAPAHAVAVLAAPVCAEVDSYQFDVVLRLAAARGVSALVLADPNARPPTSTSVDIAERFGVVILRQAVAINLADLVCGLDAALRGTAELALHRAVVASEHVTPARAADPDTLVADVAAIAAADIAIADGPDGGVAFPVGPADDAERWVVVRDADAATRPELTLVGRMLAYALMQAAVVERRARELPIRSRAELLSELLDSSERGRSELLSRARSLGLPIDGWHLAVRIELDERDRTWSDEVAAFAGREEFGRIALDRLRGSGTWHLARSDQALLLIQMHRRDPGPTAAADGTRAVQRALDEAVKAAPWVDAFCGVGSAHGGPTGLITSAAEARAAVAALRARGRANAATAFDGLGLRRTLVEWYASHAARTAVEAVLAPLDRLGETKAASAIRTLQVYLDNHGSLSRTAAELHLHRNSVSYRVDRIFAELDVDPHNPDDWLLLQLACRARGLA